MLRSYCEEKLIESIISKILKDSRFKYSHVFDAESGIYIHFRYDDSCYAIIWINEKIGKLLMEYGSRQSSNVSNPWEKTEVLGPISDLATCMGRALYLLKDGWYDL
jgi:hypothetical protein